MLLSHFFSFSFSFFFSFLFFFFPFFLLFKVLLYHTIWMLIMASYFTLVTCTLLLILLFFIHNTKISMFHLFLPQSSLIFPSRSPLSLALQYARPQLLLSSLSVSVFLSCYFCSSIILKIDVLLFSAI